MDLQFGKLTRLSGWASAAPVRSQDCSEPDCPDCQTAQTARARASGSPPTLGRQAPRHRCSPDQTWLVSPCPSARTHARNARTHTQPTQGLGRTTGWAGSWARTHHHPPPGTLELNPTRPIISRNLNQTPKASFEIPASVVHQFFFAPVPTLSTTPSALHLSVPSTDDAGHLVCLLSGFAVHAKTSLIMRLQSLLANTVPRITAHRDTHPIRFDGYNAIGLEL